MGYSLMCTYKVSELYHHWWMEMIGVRRLEKLVRFLERGGAGQGVLLTGVPLCLSLPGGDRTVLVGEQNLL